MVSDGNVQVILTGMLSEVSFNSTDWIVPVVGCDLYNITKILQLVNISHVNSTEHEFILTRVSIPAQGVAVLCVNLIEYSPLLLHSFDALITPFHVLKLFVFLL